MEHCLSCGAPLTPDNPVCAYCGVYQPIDLTLLGQHRALQLDVEANCPECKTPLQGLELEIKHQHPVLHCAQCNGLAFSTSELPVILDTMTPQVMAANRALIDNLLALHPLNSAVHYRPCPICQVLMNRRTAGERSGVIVDYCTHDDITWLDDGKLKRLYEWRQAGGGILEHQRHEEQAPASSPPAGAGSERYLQDVVAGSPAAVAGVPPASSVHHSTLAERIAEMTLDEGGDTPPPPPKP